MSRLHNESCSPSSDAVTRVYATLNSEQSVIVPTCFFRCEFVAKMVKGPPSGSLDALLAMAFERRAALSLQARTLLTGLER